MPRRSIRRRSTSRALELALAAPQVIALRSLRTLAAWDRPTARDRREWALMTTEKADAFTRSIAAMNGQWLRAGFEWPVVLMREWWRWWLVPWTTAAGFAPPRRGRSAIERHWQRSAARAFDAGLAPVHATAVANLRRLGRAKRRSPSTAM